jgi:hypothetical protein
MKTIAIIILSLFTINTLTKAEPPIPKVSSQIHFTAIEHDFGSQPVGKPISWDFEFINNGSEPLLLEDVKASCGCTTPTWTKEPVLPSKKGVVKAQYNMARDGSFRKSITVTTKGGETIVLYISGNAVVQEQGINKAKGNMLGGSDD